MKAQVYFFVLFVLLSIRSINAGAQCASSPTLTGSQTICGSAPTTTYSYSTEAGMTNYSWSVTGGTIFNPPPYGNSILVIWSSSGSISVNYTDTNNCTPSSPTSKSVTVDYTSPTLSGNTNVCLNSTNNIYTTDIGKSSYTWSVSGGTITSPNGSNSVAVTWTSTVSPFVSVSYINANGCSGVSSQPITVNSTIASISGPSSSCTSTIAQYQTQANKSNYTWSIIGGQVFSGNSVVNVIWDTASPTNTISVSYLDFLGCVATPSASKTVNVVNLPTPTITGNTNPCQATGGYVYTTEPGMTSYNWVFSWPASPPSPVPSGTITSGSGTNSITAKWYTAGAQTLSVNYVTPEGCLSNTQVLNTNIKAVSFPIITGPSAPCQGSSAVYSAQSGQPVYNWSVSSGGTITSGAGTNTITVLWSTPAVSGTYKIVSVNYGILPNGCQSPTTDFYLNVYPQPILGNPPDYGACSGDTMNLNLVTSVSASFSWVAADNPNTTGESITPQSSPVINNTIINNTLVDQSVIYTITATSTAGACVASGQIITVSVKPKPIITSPISASVCSGVSLNFPLTSSPASSTFSWVAIDNPNTTGESTTPQGTSVINNTIINNTLSPQSVTYSITPTSSLWGCVGVPQTVTVTVNPKPNITNTLTASGCSGNALNIPLTSSVPSSFSWIATDNPNTTGESTTPQSSSVINNAIINSTTIAQSVSYNLTPTSSAGACVGAPQILIITIYPKPSMTSSPSVTICSGTTLNFSLTSSLPSTFSWVASDNPNTIGESTTAQIGSFINNTIANNTTVAQTVTYTVTPTSTAGTCAGASQAVTITVNPQPAMSSPSTGTVCTGIALNFTLISSVTSSFSWLATDNPNTTGESTIAQNSSVINNIITNNTGVAQSVTYSITPTSTTGACIGVPQTLTITVNPLPVASISPSGATTFCQGGSVTLTASLGSGYLWSTGATTQAINVSIGGNYSVAVTNSNGCKANSSTTAVNVNGLPPATITPSGATTFCQGGSVTLTASAGASYVWSTGATAQSIFVTTNGNYSVTVTNASGCSATSATTTVTVNSLPTVTVSPSSATVCSGSSATLTASGLANYSWSPSTGLSSTTGATVNASPSVSTTYTVSGTTSSGCPGSRTVTVSWASSASISVSPSSNICASGYAILTANPTGGTYSWSNGSTSRSITVNSPGSYSVVVRIGSCNLNASRGITRTGTNCGNQRIRSDESDLTTPPDDFVDVKVKGSSFYPNPVDKELTALLEEPAKVRTPIRLMDQLGKSLIDTHFEVGESKKRLYTEHLMEGLYLLIISDKRDFPYKQKVLIVHKP